MRRWRWCECSCDASFVPPGGGLVRSLTQAGRYASRRVWTIAVARTNDRADQVDYAGLVTSSDLAANTGESSVERSIMVVRLAHKVTRSRGIRPVSVRTGTAGTLCGEEGRPCGTPCRRRHTTCRTTCPARAAGTPSTRTWCAATSAAASPPRCRVTSPEARPGSGLEQHLHRATLVHRPVTLRHLCQR